MRSAETRNQLTSKSMYVLAKHIEPKIGEYSQRCPIYSDVAATATTALGFPVTAANIVTAFRTLGIPLSRQHPPKNGRRRQSKSRGEPVPTAAHVRVLVTSMIELRQEFGLSCAELQQVLNELDEQPGSAQGMLIKP